MNVRVLKSVLAHIYDKNKKYPSPDHQRANYGEIFYFFEVITLTTKSKVSVVTLD